MTRQRLSMILGAIALLMLAATRPVQAEVRELQLGFEVGDTSDSAPTLTLREKPATFGSFAERLDYLHDNFHVTMQQYVNRLDTVLADEDGPIEQTPASHFRLASYIVYKGVNGTDISLEPDLEMEVDLPNLERSLKVFFESSRTDDLPGVDPSERKEGNQIGVRHERKTIRTDVGIKAKWLPQMFARAEWRPQWVHGHTLFQPRQRVFYETGDGIGSLTSLTAHRWFGPNTDLYWQSITAGRYTTKSTDGVEFEQTFKVGWIGSVLESEWNWRRVPGESDLARGHILRYSLFGHVSSEEEQIDRHRLTYTYRRPIYKKWIYLEAAPGVEALRENDWKVGPVVIVGVDMLFWGTVDR